MTIINNNLYRYDTIIGITSTGKSYNLDNRSMNTRELKVHKGVENTIYFKITDRDRKNQNVFNSRLIATIVDPQSHSRILTKDCAVSLQAGQCSLVVGPGDLTNIDPGFYEMFITVSPQGETEQPLYSNQNNDLKFDLEITNQSYVTPVATQTQAQWFLADASSNSYVSSAFVGNQENNYSDPQHSMSIYTQEFSGSLTIQGSLLENSPQSSYPNSEWADIFTVNLSNITSIQHFTFKINTNWLRIVNNPLGNISANTISQIQIRN